MGGGELGGDTTSERTDGGGWEGALAREEEGKPGNDSEIQNPAEGGKMEKRGCLGDSQGEKTGMSGEPSV